MAGPQKEWKVFYESVCVLKEKTVGREHVVRERTTP